eukprot:15050494-Alexandrium_andersonii.AAC.1
MRSEEGNNVKDAGRLLLNSVHTVVAVSVEVPNLGSAISKHGSVVFVDCLLCAMVPNVDGSLKRTLGILKPGRDHSWPVLTDRLNRLANHQISNGRA